MKNNVKRDYFWNTIGVFAQNAISPLLIIAITRINGIYDSGVFSFAFSVSIIFWAFGMWGGRTYQVSDIKHEFSNRSYLMVRFILAIFMLLGAIIFSLINHYDIGKSAIIIALVLFKVIESISDSLYGILQLHGRLFLSGKSLLYKALLGLIFFVVVDYLTKNILWGCMSIVFVNVLFFVFYDINNAVKFESIRIKSGQVCGVANGAIVIMKRCSPVFAVIFLTMFSLNIPRYFIDIYHAEQIGYFGILAMPITLITLIMSFILQPNIVSLSRRYEEEEYDIFQITVKKIAFVTVVMGVLIFLTSYVIGIPALELVFGISFVKYKSSLLIMIIGGIVSALVSILINILVVMRHFKGQFYSLLLTNVVLILLSSMIIKERGMIAGVFLFMITNIAQVVLLTIIYRLILKQVKLKKSDKIRLGEDI